MELTTEQEKQLETLVPTAVADVKATAMVRGEPESAYVAVVRFSPDSEPVCGAMLLKALDDEFAGHPNMCEIRGMGGGRRPSGRTRPPSPMGARVDGRVDTRRFDRHQPRRHLVEAEHEGVAVLAVGGNCNDGRCGCPMSFLELRNLRVRGEPHVLAGSLDADPDSIVALHGFECVTVERHADQFDGVEAVVDFGGFDDLCHDFGCDGWRVLVGL